MDTPERVTTCRATWIRGKEVDWWEWVYNEDRKQYVMVDSGEAMSPSYIMAAAAVKQLEGWQLCRAVV